MDALAGKMDVNEETWNTDDEAIDEFLDNFSEESLNAGQPTSIDEALEMPLGKIDEAVQDNDFWEEMLGDTMRGYVRLILVDLAENVFESMEQRKNRI